MPHTLTRGGWVREVHLMSSPSVFGELNQFCLHQWNYLSSTWHAFNMTNQLYLWILHTEGSIMKINRSWSEHLMQPGMQASLQQLVPDMDWGGGQWHEGSDHEVQHPKTQCSLCCLTPLGFRMFIMILVSVEFSVFGNLSCYVENVHMSWFHHDFDEIFIIGCLPSCHFDNFQCNQWWKLLQNYDISFPVMYG